VIGDRDLDADSVNDAEADEEGTGPEADARTLCDAVSPVRLTETDESFTALTVAEKESDVVMDFDTDSLGRDLDRDLVSCTDDDATSDADFERPPVGVR
jgi:hypothetical protein